MTENRSSHGGGKAPRPTAGAPGTVYEEDAYEEDIAYSDDTEGTGAEGIDDDYGDSFADPDSRSRSIKLMVLIVVLALLALVGGGYLAVRLAGTDEPVETTDDGGPEAPVEEMTEDGAEIEVREGENPFAAEMDVESVSIPDGAMTVPVSEDGDSFEFSDVDLALAVGDDASITETEGEECVLLSDTDICYAGYVSVDGMDDLEVFAVRNIVENRLLEINSDVVPTSVEGAEHAFVGNVVVDTEEYAMPFLAVAGENGSGFLMMFSDNIQRDVDDFNGYQEHLSIEQ